MLRLSLVSAMILAANADCPNACSGRGVCREHDQCKCDPGYIGHDCSARVCNFGYTFVDTPRGDLNHNGMVSDADGNVKVQWSNVKEYEVFPTDASVYAAQENEAHFYAECSGKGECDRETGECKCFNGYTGGSCERTSCPKDCSGHGVCRTLKEIAAGALNKREYMSVAGHKYFSGVRNAFNYNLWDADKHQACVCDPGFGGIDCSLRLCPRGDDPITTGTRWCGGQECTWEQQAFTLSSDKATTYKIGFTDSLNNTVYAYATVDTLKSPLGYVAPADQGTYLPGPTTVAGQIMQALRDIPGGMLQRVEVYAGTGTTDRQHTFYVTFVGVPGDQAQLTVSVSAGPGSLAVNPESTDSSKTVVTLKNGNFEDYECSGRGACDNTSGLCKCFPGFKGAACEHQNALA